MIEGRDEGVFERLMRDADADWPDRLLHDLAQAPLVDEAAIRYKNPARLTLTERELEVLRCASVGLEMEHTADLLFVSFNTVQSHLKSARYRLRAKNTAHACCLALRQGLIE